MAARDTDVAGGSSRPGSSALPKWLVATSLVVFAGYLSAVIRYAWLTSYFYGDDFQALHVMRTMPWSSALLVPLGGQIVPLHRLLTFAIQTVAPLRFEVALGVLAGLHVLAAFCLYRVLDLLEPGRENALLVAVYGTPLVLGSNLVWFTSGMTRFPYLVLTLVAVFHYVRHARTRAPRDLAVVVVAYVAALGFYSKAILIPLYCVGLDAVRPRAPDEAPFFARGDLPRWALIAGLLVADALYVPGVRSLTDPASRATNTSLGLHLAFQGLAWNVFVHALFDRVLEFRSYHPSPVIWACVALLVAYSVARARTALRAWLVLAALVSANFLVVAASSRTIIWGGLMVFETRHYFELMFLVLLFAKVVLVRARAAPPLLPRRPRPGPRLARAAWASVAALLVLHAARSFASFDRLQATYASDLPQARAYMRRLLSNLDSMQVADGPPRAFADGPLPPYLDPADVDMRQLSDLFTAIGVNAGFVPLAQAEFVVSPTGNVSRPPGVP